MHANKNIGGGGGGGGGMKQKEWGKETKTHR